jgi:CRISPR-associated protein Cas2
MAEQRHWYLLIYDVRDDKRLRKVHKLCLAWGHPVQLSVFRVRGTERELARLEFELARVMEPEDRLLLVRLCPGCAGRVSVKGEQLEPFDLEIPNCRIL